MGSVWVDLGTIPVRFWGRSVVNWARCGVIHARPTSGVLPLSIGSPRPRAPRCPSDALKAEPGLCGCGATDVDSDVDGVPDCYDRCLGSDRLVAALTFGFGPTAVTAPGGGACVDGVRAAAIACAAAM